MADEVIAQVTPQSPAAPQATAAPAAASDPAAAPVDGQETAAPAAPPAPDADAFAKRFEGAARLEARAREALRTAETKRPEWEAAAEKRAEDRIVAEMRRDMYGALKARGVSEKEAIFLSQQTYAKASGVPPAELPIDVQQQMKWSEFEAWKDKLDRERAEEKQQQQQTQTLQADFQAAHSILGKIDDSAAFAKAEFSADPVGAVQEFTRLYYQMHNAGRLVGFRNRDEVAKAVSLQYDRNVRERVEGTVSRHGHAMTQTTKAQPKTAPAADKADVTSVPGPATRPESRPKTDKEWRAQFDKLRKNSRT